eukprot:8399344-Pyramimonas_sp.AAC.1
MSLSVSLSIHYRSYSTGHHGTPRDTTSISVSISLSISLNGPSRATTRHRGTPAGHRGAPAAGG